MLLSRTTLETESYILSTVADRAVALKRFPLPVAQKNHYCSSLLSSRKRKTSKSAIDILPVCRLRNFVNRNPAPRVYPLSLFMSLIMSA